MLDSVPVIQSFIDRLGVRACVSSSFLLYIYTYIYIPFNLSWCTYHTRVETRAERHSQHTHAYTRTPTLFLTLESRVVIISSLSRARLSAVGKASGCNPLEERLGNLGEAGRRARGKCYDSQGKQWPCCCCYTPTKRIYHL